MGTGPTAHDERSAGDRVPAVSVVIPAWQAKETIAGTLDSLLRQTEPDWEAVVVDDGSDDGTADIVAAREAQDPRIRLVREGHGGVSRARNRGIAAARADWLLFLDADDLLEASALSALLAATSPGVDLVMGAYTRVTPDGRRLSGDLPPSPQDWFPVLAYRCPTTINACLVRRAVVDAVGRFDPGLATCEDWDLWQRVVRRGRVVATVSESVAIYCVRRTSALQDEHRFVSDAVTVIRRAHAPDPRVPDAAAAHQQGEPAALSAGRLLLVACWAAGQAIGAGRDGATLLEILSDEPVLGFDVDWAAENIAAGMEVHGHGRGWDELGPLLNRLLAALGQRVVGSAVLGHVRRRLEGAVLSWTPSRAAVAGSTYGLRLQLGEPVEDVRLPAGTDVLRVQVEDAGELVGVVTLPGFNGEVRGLVIADAIASELGWQVLGRFFAATVYPETAVHDEVGWVTLLRELWDRPDWSESDFYDAARNDASAGRSVAAPEEGWLTVEVGPVVPRVKRMEGDLHVAVTIGGRRIGAISLPAQRGLTGQQLRAAICTESGMELCVATVREGLLTGARGDSLRARLDDAASRVRDVQASGPMLGRHPRGDVASPASRHADLPVEAVDVLEPLIAAHRQPITMTGPAASVRYAPDLLWSSPPPPSQSPHVDAVPRGDAVGRHEFEALFAESADPWRYETDYERVKYAETLELLPDGPIHDALELGCASGHFTRLLAPRVHRLVAADISSLALAAARERCREKNNIEYRQLDLRTEALPGRFDLIVCSEMLYYAADRESLPRLMRRLAAALRPGGHILTTHAHTTADDGPLPAFDWDNVPFGAAYIGATLKRTPGLVPLRELRTPLYRIQLFRQVGQARRVTHRLRGRTPHVEERPLTAELRPEVAARVRWDAASVASAPSNTVETDRLPILMYHRIADAGPEALSRYRVSRTKFEEQLHYLQSAGFRGVTLDEWAAARRYNAPLPGRAVLITFDDAYADFGDEAWPLLKRYGFPATLFVPTAHVGGTNTWDQDFGATVPLLGWDELRALSSEGVTMGAHGHTHRPLPALAPREVAQEAARSRVELEDRLATPVTAVAYPYGQHDGVSRHLHGSSGFLHGLTIRSALSSLRDQALSLPRLEVSGSDDLAGFIRKLGSRGY